MEAEAIIYGGGASSLRRLEDMRQGHDWSFQELPGSSLSIRQERSGSIQGEHLGNSIALWRAFVVLKLSRLVFWTTRGSSASWGSASRCTLAKLSPGMQSPIPSLLHSYSGGILARTEHLMPYGISARTLKTYEINNRNSSKYSDWSWQENDSRAGGPVFSQAMWLQTQPQEKTKTTGSVS